MSPARPPEGAHSLSEGQGRRPEGAPVSAATSIAAANSNPPPAVLSAEQRLAEGFARHVERWALAQGAAEGSALALRHAAWALSLATASGDVCIALRDIEALVSHSQHRVIGDTRVRVAPGRFQVVGARSPHSMMDARVATYGEEHRLWTGDEARAFARVAAIPALLAARAGGAD